MPAILRGNHQGVVVADKDEAMRGKDDLVLQTARAYEEVGL